MKKNNIWLAILLLAMFGLVAQADETVTIVSSADTWMQNTTSTHGSDNYMNIYGNGTSQNMGYVRFDLSGFDIGNVVDASLKMTISGNASNNSALTTGRYGLHGLNNITGNTSQSWSETTLNKSNTGSEVDWTAGTVVMANVTNLDSDDTTGTTETIVNGPGGAADVGTTITTTGAPLVSFLQSRVDENGLATFIIRQDAGGGAAYGLCTKENTTVEYRPVLTLTFNSGGAENPQPANNATANRGLLTRLSWNLVSELGINKCDVYLGTEPNLTSMAKLTFTPAVESVAIDDFPGYGESVPSDGVYYWRVDCYNGNPLPAEPNVPGPYWSFIATSAPVVAQQTTPAFQARFAGETAEFTVIFSSYDPVTYAWYRSTDNANNTPDDDVSVGTNSNSLSLPNVTLANAGYYYCKATNPSEARSNPTRLSIKRQLAHWALDGNADDSSGNAFHGILSGTPVFDAGVNGTTGQAMVFDGVDDSIKEPNDFSDFTPGMTISVWAKPTAAGSYARFIDFGNGAPSDNIFFGRAAATSNLILGIHVGTGASSTVTATGVMVLNEWQMFIATVNESGTVTLYKNGLPVQTGTMTQMPTIITRTSNYIGKSNWTADAMYAGSMDDIQIWNFAKSADDVADMYSDVAGNFCRTRPTFDWDNSCKVDLGDFGILAGEWLDCGLYPDCP